MELDNYSQYLLSSLAPTGVIVRRRHARESLLNYDRQERERQGHTQITIGRAPLFNPESASACERRAKPKTPRRSGREGSA